MGWHMLVLPSRARKRLSELVAQPSFEITDASYVDGSTPVHITHGEVSAWQATREPKLRVEIVLGGGDLAAVIRALRDKQDLIAIPGLEDVRLCFSDR